MAGPVGCRSARRASAVAGLIAAGCALGAAGGAVAGAPVAAIHASFACAKARTPTERTICKHPELARLDARMAANYRAALKSTPEPVRLIASQRAWLKARAAPTDPENGRRGAPRDPLQLALYYRDRIAAQETTRRVDAAAPKSFPARDLDRRCVPLAIRWCKVTRAGPVADPTHRTRMTFQLQETTRRDEDEVWNGVVVFDPLSAGRLKPLLWSFDPDARFTAPEVVASRDAGLLLVLHARREGPGKANAERLFHKVGGRWRDIDVDSWLKDLPGRLPHGLQVREGVDYDFATLTGRARVWRAHDADCCPTGGDAGLSFAVKGDRLVLEGLTLSRTSMLDRLRRLVGFRPPAHERAGESRRR